MMKITRIMFAGPVNGWAVRLGKWLRSRGIEVGWTASGGFSRVFYGQLNDPWYVFRLYRFTKSFREAKRARTFYGDDIYSELEDRP